jgi:hypothetical protein
MIKVLLKRRDYNTMSEYGSRAAADLMTRSQAESVVERVYLAVKHLCTGRGDVRKRLVGAINALSPLRAREFPEELQKDFEWVMTESTKYKSKITKNEGSIEATMKRIRNSTGEKIAVKIFNIYSGFQNIRGFPLLDYRPPDE